MTGPEQPPPVADAATAATHVPTLGTLPVGDELLPSMAGLPTIPGYEVLGELGRGGMGVVFKARQIKLNRLVAIKMLPGDWRGDAELETRFRTEAEAVARLQHPNIVQIFEVGEAAGRPFLALEFVPGGTLSQFLARKPQDAHLAARLTESLARAVHHAHLQGILHRDLKPANILMQERFTAEGAEGAEKTKPDSSSAPSAPSAVKITDFGLAKHLNASDGPTQAGDILGTPSYMAPEQASGVAQRLTAGVDIYALGVILYEMLIGRPPFLGATPTETVVQVLAQDPVAPRELRPDCPRDLETICLKCLEKNPAKRYATAEDLAEDLRRFQAGDTIRARPAGKVERVVKWAKRRPGSAAAIVVGVIAALLVLLLSVGFNYRLTQKNSDLKIANERERESTKRARANFEKARQVVKDVLSDVAVKDLESVPQMDPVRRSLMLKAIKAQQDFLDEKTDDPEVLRDLARAHIDVGEIYYDLGDYAAADKHYAEAVAIFERLGGSPEMRLGVATGLMYRGDALLAGRNFADAELYYVRAGEEAERVIAANPGLADAVYLRARIRVDYGQHLARSGKFDMARSAFEQSRDEFAQLAERYPERLEFPERQARALNNLGALFMSRGQYGMGAPAFRKAEKIMAGLTDKDPVRREYRWEFALFAGSTGNALWWQTELPPGFAIVSGNAGIRMWRYGEFPIADGHYRLSIDELHRMAQDFPHVPFYRHQLARSLEMRAELLDYDQLENKPPTLPKEPAGRSLLLEALNLKLKLIEEQPQNPDYLTSVGVTYSYLAVAAGRRKRVIERAGWELAEMVVLKKALAAGAAPARTRQFLTEALARFSYSASQIIPLAWLR
jgi:serine/threonine protein kinase